MKKVLVIGLAVAILLGIVLVGTASGQTIIDDFEDGDIAEYTGNISNFSVATNKTYNGSYSLKGGPGGNVEIFANASGGLNAYPHQGDTFTFYYNSNVSSSGADPGHGTIHFGGNNSNNCYFINMAPWDDDLNLGIIQGGSETTLNTTSYTWNADMWYNITVRWQDDGTFNVTLYDVANGTVEVKINTVNNTFNGTGFGWEMSDGDDVKYFDYAYIHEGAGNASLSIEDGSIAFGNSELDTVINTQDIGDQQTVNTSGASGAQQIEIKLNQSTVVGQTNGTGLSFVTTAPGQDEVKCDFLGGDITSYTALDTAYQNYSTNMSADTTDSLDIQLSTPASLTNDSYYDDYQFEIVMRATLL